MMSNNTFICKAPWTSIAFQPTGVAPCCVFDLDKVEKFTDPQNLFQQIKKDFKSGKIPSGCSKCSQNGAQGLPGYYTAFDQYTTDFNEANIQEINLKANNFCNLACRSCGPHFSSKWEEEFKGTIFITTDDQVMSKIDQLDISKLKTIVFAGGEPTMSPEHVQLLNALIQINHTTPVIRIATNLHNLTYKNINLISLWKHFPNLYLNVSIDAIEERAKYIRSGTNWEKMVSNLKELLNHNITCGVSFTVSALNIWFLEETLDYLKDQFNIDVPYFNILLSPDILNLSVIPLEFKEKLNIMLNRCLSKGYQVKPIIQYLNLHDTSVLWPQFLIYNLLLDVSRNEKFCQTLPIYDSLISQWVKL